MYSTAAVVLALAVAFVHTQDCPPVDRTFVGNNIITQLAETSNFNYKVLCYVHGNRSGLYRSASLAINYLDPPNNLTVLKSITCSTNGNTWFSSPGGFVSANISIFDETFQDQCSACTNNISSICTREYYITVILNYILIACNSSCIALGGSGRCYGPSSDECCPFYLIDFCSSTCPSGQPLNSSMFSCGMLNYY